jgi:superfamily II DNA helicase RecQ
MKKLKISIFSILFLFLSVETQAAITELEIDFNDENSRTLEIDINEGKKEIINIKNAGVLEDVKYTISKGVDKDLFSLKKISTSEVVLLSVRTLDFENQKDTNEDNIYEIVIKGKSKNKEIEQSLQIKVQNVEYPFLVENAIAQSMKRANKHKRPVCKNSRAINFNNVGVHYESLCVYEKDNIEDEIEEMKGALNDISIKLSVLVRAKKQEKTYLVSNKKAATVAIVRDYKVEEIIEETTEEESEILSDNNSGQSASIFGAQGNSKSLLYSGVF